MLFTHERTRAVRYLAAQVTMCIVVAFLLLGVYRADLINTPGTSNVVRGAGLANVLNVERIASNLRLALQPIPPPFLTLLIATPVVGVVLVLRKSGGARVPIAVSLSSSILLDFPWIASAYSAGETDSLRFVLPATVAALILIGGMLWYLGALGVTILSTRARSAVWAGIVLVSAMALRESAVATIHLVRDRQRADWRVELRAWADASLDPGLILVSYDNEKTFNPFWGGLASQSWFDWLVVEDFASRSPDSWRSERGAVYAALPYELAETHADMTTGWLHLRDFASPPDKRGPEVAVYRLWKPQTALLAEFGGQIALVGYDLSPEQFAPGNIVRLRPYWQTLAPVRGDYSAFLHLVREGESVPLVQADGAPAQPTRPTLTWDTPNETLIGALFEVDVPADLPPGQYSLRLGLYDYLTGIRLQLTDDRDWIELASLTLAE